MDVAPSQNTESYGDDSGAETTVSGWMDESEGELDTALIAGVGSAGGVVVVGASAAVIVNKKFPDLFRCLREKVENAITGIDLFDGDKSSDKEEEQPGTRKKKEKHSNSASGGSSSSSDSSAQEDEDEKRHRDDDTDGDEIYLI